MGELFFRRKVEKGRFPVKRPPTRPAETGKTGKISEMTSLLTKMMSGLRLTLPQPLASKSSSLLLNRMTLQQPKDGGLLKGRSLFTSPKLDIKRPDYVQVN